MLTGLVIKSTGSSYVVQMDDGSSAECHVKGNFRIRGIRSTSPVAVGDIVTVQRQTDGTHWITDIAERRNYIVRRATNLSKESHILAANLDQVALLVTVAHPATSTVFIDRFLANAEAYRVPVTIVFNKVDLLSKEDVSVMQSLRALYESLGYTTYAISATQLVSQMVVPLFLGKTTLLAGNSGVGKSTLLNALMGEQRTRTGVISSAHDKGMHTTTFSEMYSLSQCPYLQSGEELDRGWIIDTPGIKGFGSIAMEKEEVGHYFREIFRVSQRCRYSNCLHISEPDCAVLPAIETGEIALSRFESYMSMLGDCEESKYR